jgi:hypothetical protein
VIVNGAAHRDILLRSRVLQLWGVLWDVFPSLPSLLPCRPSNATHSLLHPFSFGLYFPYSYVTRRITTAFTNIPTYQESDGLRPHPHNTLPTKFIFALSFSAWSSAARGLSASRSMDTCPRFASCIFPCTYRSCGTSKSCQDDQSNVEKVSKYL